MNRRFVWLLACTPLWLGGCNHVIYVHNATAGLDLHASPTEGNVRLIIGGERATGAIVPKKGGSVDESEAMALTAFSRVSMAGIRDIKFGHIVATGAPAIDLAQRPKDMSKIVDKVFGDEADTGGKP